MPGYVSALAWASSFSPDQVEIIKNWPSSGQLVGSQAPTEIAYEDGDTTAFSWGYDIPPQTRKVSADNIFRFTYEASAIAFVNGLYFLLIGNVV